MDNLDTSARRGGSLRRSWTEERVLRTCGAEGRWVRAAASQPVAGKIEQSYTRRLRQLPAETRLLVLVAAAEPLGDPVLFHRAARTLGVGLAAAVPAVDTGLLRVVAGMTQPCGTDAALGIEARCRAAQPRRRRR